MDCAQCAERADEAQDYVDLTRIALLRLGAALPQGTPVCRVGSEEGCGLDADQSGFATEQCGKCSELAQRLARALQRVRKEPQNVRHLAVVKSTRTLISRHEAETGHTVVR